MIFFWYAVGMAVLFLVLAQLAKREDRQHYYVLAHIWIATSFILGQVLR